MAQPGPQSGVGLQQVFISHTGADEQGRWFAASVLKPALEAAGIATYIDYNNLELGCEWPGELMEAATGSAVFVAVLTRSYATRFWCLRELDLALNRPPDSPQPLIIPVYIDHYSSLNSIRADDLKADIDRRINKLSTAADSAAAELCDLRRLVSDPAHLQRMVHGNLVSLQGLQAVRRQHQDAPQQLQGQQQVPSQEVPTSVARVPALKDEEWQLAYRVVLAALHHLPRLAHVPQDVLGYEEELATLAARVAVKESGAPGDLGLWLHGPGGFGKTTMADLLWNAMSKHFPKNARIELDLDGSSSSQLHDTLTSLLKQLGLPEPKTGDVKVQLKKLSDFVADHKVLLLYDNVNHVAQLEALLPTSFSKGSRVIITSRLRGLDRTSNAYKALVSAGLHHHKMLGLKGVAAQELFRQQHTLEKAQLTRLCLISWETDLIAACSGLPLALRVIGAALTPDDCCKSDDDIVKRWKEVHAFCEGLWTAPGGSDTAVRLQDVVYYTFQHLSPAAQNIFLDCVSVLHDESYSAAMMVWEAWWPRGAHQAFGRLQQLSLVTTDEDDKIKVLDVIRSLGQSIILTKDRPDRLGDTFTGSRIWFGPDGTARIAKEVSRPVAVALSGCLAGAPLEYWDLSDLRIFMSHAPSPNVLLRAPKLLWLRRIQLTTGPCQCSWEQQWGPEMLPLGHPLQNLVRLDLVKSSRWDVRGLDSWRMVVDVVGKANSLPALQVLELDANFMRYSSTATVEAFAHTIGSSTNLKDLSLQDLTFKSLQDASNLPGELWVPAIAKLQALTKLCISYCPGVSWAGLLVVAGQLTRLKVLDIPDPGDALDRPPQISKLQDLQQLHINQWERLTGLQEWFGNLHKLQTLRMSSCQRLTSLPVSLSGLSHLQALNINWCGSLKGLPTSVGDLTSLTKLDLSRCSSLSLLPSSVSGLLSLQELDLSYCEKINSLPKLIGRLVNLRFLNLTGCTTLNSLPRSLGGLVSLTEMKLCDCRCLISLPRSIGHLTALQHLHLGDCKSLTALPGSFGGLSSLRRLSMFRCKLHALPGSITSLVQLTELNLSNCQLLTCLPAGFTKLPSLEDLRLDCCTSLDIDVASLLQLPALSVLTLSGCTQLRNLPDAWPGIKHVYLP